MTHRARSRSTRLALLIGLAAIFGCQPKDPQARPQPYDESADAAAEVASALAEAGAAGKLVLLVFGANWCPDCRALATAMTEPAIHKIVDNRFSVVHIDIGRWDKNTELVERWGNPTSRGIPSVVVARANGEVVYATTKGEVSTARRMGEDQFAEFFRLMASLK